MVRPSRTDRTQLTLCVVDELGEAFVPGRLVRADCTSSDAGRATVPWLVLSQLGNEQLVCSRIVVDLGVKFRFHVEQHRLSQVQRRFHALRRQVVFSRDGLPLFFFEAWVGCHEHFDGGIPITVTRWINVGCSDVAGRENPA